MSSTRDCRRVSGELRNFTNFFLQIYFLLSIRNVAVAEFEKRQKYSISRFCVSDFISRVDEYLLHSISEISSTRQSTTSSARSAAARSGETRGAETKSRNTTKTRSSSPAAPLATTTSCARTAAPPGGPARSAGRRGPSTSGGPSWRSTPCSGRRRRAL